MKRAIAMALIASSLLAGHAAGQPAAQDASAVAGRTMDAPFIAVPVVRDGQLVNYLFVSLRFEVAPGVDLWRTRERAHFLRDALVRAAHGADLAMPGRQDTLNTPVALAAFRAAAASALGPNAIRNVSVLSMYAGRRTNHAQR